jgi:hypothetical protein
MTTTARLPAGASAGGRFSAAARAESEVPLNWTPPLAPAPGAAPSARPGPVALDPSRLTPPFAARLRQDAADRFAGRAAPLIRR